MADVVAVPDDPWLVSAEEELRQLIDDMLYTEKTHLAASERLKRIHLRLGLVSTVLAAAAGATIVANWTVVAGLLALGATVASGVLTFMKPDAVAEQHLGAGRQLARIRVRARQLVDLDLHTLGTTELRAAISAVADDKAGVDDVAPATTNKDFSAAQKAIQAGTYDRDR